MTSAPSSSSSSTAQSGRRFVKDMGAPEFVRGIFSIANAQIGQTRQGKPYLKCIVGDSSGEMPARMWSIDEPTYKRLPSEGFVYLEGETQPYQGELQLIIHNIDLAEPTPDEMRDLLPVSKRDVGEMFGEVTTLLATLKHPAAQALAAAYLADEYLMDAFRRAPAAKSMHHAYLGGLLEHTLTLMQIADRLCPLYPKINRDIVMLGVFLHDLGKTRELQYDRAFGYTDRGELIGHIVDGVIMLHDKSQQVMREKSMRFPAGFITILQHIIISHHGEPEYGAAKIPGTPEAVLINLIDNLDAKTVMALAAARPDRTQPVELGGSFTEKQWALQGAKLYKKDPLA